MAAAGIRSIYELALLVDRPRGTLRRWLSGRVRLPVEGVRQLVDGLAEHVTATANAHQALTELVRLAEIDPDAPDARLRAELRARGIRLRSALAAVRAAGLQIVPADDDPISVPRTASTQHPNKEKST